MSTPAVSVGLRVAVTDLRKTFIAGGSRVAACDGLTFTVEPGSVTALTGPSGCGKSTLLHLIAGIEAADSGQIRVGDQDITSLSRRRLTAYRRTVGLVFQQFNLLPALTAQDNVMAPLLPYRVDFDVPARARELLDQVGLAGREGSLPSQLSGGQQQRVAIARALINRPGLILADEPTGALDTANGESVLRQLLDLRDQLGVTIVIATHDRSIAARCDTAIRLLDGQLLDPDSVAAGDSP